MPVPLSGDQSAVDADCAEWSQARRLLPKAADLFRVADVELASAPEPFELVPRTFTIPELRSVFEVVKGQPYDPGNFRRKFNRLMEDGVLEKAPGKRITGARPAQVFFFKR
ncbi:MAG: hypothetical protein WBV82_16270, partial [Myxococcaceae bacterium]